MRIHTVSFLKSQVKPMVNIAWQRSEWLSKWLPQVRNLTQVHRIKSTAGPAAEELIWIWDKNDSNPPSQKNSSVSSERGLRLHGVSRDTGYWLPLESRAWNRDSREGNLHWKAISRRWNGRQWRGKEGRREGRKERKRLNRFCSWVGSWSSILPSPLGISQNTLPSCPPEDWRGSI